MSKRKEEDREEPAENPKLKRSKSTKEPEKNPARVLTPQGLAWYHNSCAYDATISIVHAIWSQNPQQWSQIFRNTNEELLGKLGQDFAKHGTGTQSLEAARDSLRRQLAQISAEQFKWGELTSVHHVMQYLLTTAGTTIESYLECSQHHNAEHALQAVSNCYVVSAGTTSPVSISQWMADWKEPTQHQCTTCGRQMNMMFQFHQPWHLIAFDFAWQRTEIDPELLVHVNGDNVLYKLRGIIYFGENHFTSRIISEMGQTWFHDGITTGQSVIYEGDVQDVRALNMCQGKQASMAVYTKANE